MIKIFCIKHSILLWLLCSSLAWANVTSGTGSILFDINNDRSPEAVLNSSGLGLGTTPSANLHVVGNAIVSSFLSVGTSSVSSNINIGGTFGMNLEEVSDNVTIGGNSMILADSSSGNMTLTLMDASSAGDGLVVHVKKISSSFEVTVVGGGAIDGRYGWTLNSNAMGYIRLMSSSGAWFILSSRDISSFPWTPEAVTTLGWFDANDTSTISDTAGALDEWRDKSGNDKHIGASATYSTGTRTLNGLNVLDSPGSVGLTSNNTPVPASGDMAVFVVAELDVIDSTDDAIISIGGGGDKFQLVSNHASQFDGKIDVSGLGSDKSLSGGSFSGPSVFAVVFDYSGTKDYNAYIDGSLRTTEAPNTYTSQLPTSSRKLRPFVHSTGGSGFMDGAIAEIITIEDVTESTRQIVEGYLAWKWGLEANLPADHLYKTASP